MENTNPTPTTKSIKQVVAEKISASGRTVEAIVVETLAGNEITRRSDLIINGLAQLDKLKSAQNKLRPDFKTIIVVDGKSTPQESWTPAGFKAFEESAAKIVKLELLINTALEKNDPDSYGKLASEVK